MDHDKGKEKNCITTVSSTSPKEDEKKASQPDAKKAELIATPNTNSKTPSMDDVKAHICANFPDFDVSALFDTENKNKVTFAKGVTPSRTPTSYYNSHTPHSYSKGFSPGYSKAFTPGR